MIREIVINQSAFNTFVDAIEIRNFVNVTVSANFENIYFEQDFYNQKFGKFDSLSLYAQNSDRDYKNIILHILKKCKIVNEINDIIVSIDDKNYDSLAYSYFNNLPLFSFSNKNTVIDIDVLNSSNDSYKTKLPNIYSKGSLRNTEITPYIIDDSLSGLITLEVLRYRYFNLEFNDGVDLDNVSVEVINQCLSILDHMNDIFIDGWGDNFSTTKIINYRRQSSITLEKFSDEHTFVIDGYKKKISSHIAGSLFHSRIYFFIDSSCEKIVVCQMGKHLPTVKYPEPDKIEVT